MSGSPPFAILQVQVAGCGLDEHPIVRSEVSIGRAPDNEIVLDDLQVSGRHLRLIVGTDGSVTAMDLGSLNGTRLDDQPLLPRRPCTVQPGATLQIDPFSLRVKLPTSQAAFPSFIADRVRIAPSSQPCLAVFAQGRLTKHALLKPSLQLGRTQENDIVIPVSGVSSRHATLRQSGDAWLMEDLGSSNGLYHNGQRVQQLAMRYGDVVYIGQDLALQLRACMGFVPVGSSASPAAGIRTIRMDRQDTITVGRADDNGISVDHPQVSRYHALIERLGTRHRIKDLKSANGVYVNGKRIEGETWLQEGDDIFIGPVRLRLAGGGVQQMVEAGVRLDAVRLRKWVSKSKNLLQDVSLSIHPQEFVAIVGLSGSGKSTLLNALNGFGPATQGMVLANGINLYRNYDMFRSDMGYVPQENIVHTGLTVYKALDYAAQLRMPTDTTAEERHRRVMEVLQELNLVERRGLWIDKLSGGQLKRVSIGVELLTKPRLFYLDEPTSGLDPGTEYNMMRLLRKLADQGRTILLVTHATKNVMMCDKVLILASDGYVAFYGPPEEALIYFDQYRTDYERRIKDIEFDDTYTILEDQERGTPEDWDRRYQASTAYETYVTNRFRELRQEKAKGTKSSSLKRPRVSMVRQFLILTRRYLDLVFRDRVLLTTLLVIMPAIALLLLIMSNPKSLVGEAEIEIERQLAAELAGGAKTATYAIVSRTQQLLSSMAQAAVLLGLFAAAYEIVKERPIFQRERMVTLRLFPYLNSKVVVLTAFALVQCLLFLIVIGFKVDLPKQGVFMPAPVEMYITLVLAALASILLGLLISALVSNSSTVIYVVLLILFFQIIFSGVTFELPGRGQGLSSLTLTRWANEALGSTVNVDRLNELSRTRFQPDPITEQVTMEVQIPGPDNTTVTEMVTQSVNIEPEAADISASKEFKISYARTTQHLVQSWLVLLGLGSVFGLATIGVLKWKERA